jgi:hypothetical protein
MLDNEFPNENNVLLRATSVAEPGHTRTAPPPATRSKPMRDPRPFVVIQNGTFLFIIHAYSARQARTLVAARLADTTGVLIVAQRKGSPR